MILERYWVFSVVCLAVAAVMVRLVLRERLQLKGSISYLSFLLVMGAMTVLPGPTARLAAALGFTLLSNFLFAVTLGLLSLLHLRALVSLSRVELRSVALTQELAILQERVQRLEARAPPAEPR